MTLSVAVTPESLTPVLRQRFWAKVNRGDSQTCWPWIGKQRGPGSYGILWVNGHCIVAHRISWILAHGVAIPPHRLVCHHCDYPPCVNPSHLYIGTDADNGADKARKGRASRLAEERNPAAKLTVRDVRAIRALYGTGHISHARLGQLFEVSES